MKENKTDINKLMNIKNYADREGVTASYIYKLIKDGKMSCFVIDGIQFIEIDKYPTIPVANRRK